jgi:hypothetical protein
VPGWPIELTALSSGSQGVPRPAILDVSPRGALFTLAALSHVGHPAHLALADAYLKGQVRLTPDTGIGEDTRLVVSALAAPLVAAHELGLERITLADLVLLPCALGHADVVGRTVANEPVIGTDSARFLLRFGQGWVWVRAAERFAMAGCIGTPNPGAPRPWHDVTVELPRRPHADDRIGGELALPPIAAELSEATVEQPPSKTLVSALRGLGHARWARAPLSLRRTAQAAADAVASSSCGLPPVSAADLRAELLAASRMSLAEPRVETAEGLAGLFAPEIRQRRHAAATLSLRGLNVQVSLAPELDGYLTLCLLPPEATAPESLPEPMLELARATIEALIGRPLPEHRTEPISISLHAEDGRSTILDVGVSIVIGRNQQVFAAWVGSDGRVMLRLFPPGRMGCSPE